MHRDRTKCIPFAQEQKAELGLAEPSRVRQHRLEHWLEFPGRTRDDLQHLRGRRLLLQRLAQLVEEARVLDGNDSLLSEIADQLDLLFRE